MTKITDATTSPTHDGERDARLRELLAAAGVPFAYVHDYPMPDGTYRTMTVPVNSD